MTTRTLALIVAGIAAWLAAAAPVAPAAVAGTTCAESVTQPFVRWLDPAYYALVPGGAFETGANFWTRLGGAALVRGNEPFRVHNASDDESLYLPSGSLARSNRVCIELTRPTLRFFAVNKGSALSVLKVHLFFRDSAGTLLGGVDVATLSATSTWRPTQIIPLLANATAPVGTVYVQLQFRPLGQESGWRIDDVYVDPWRSR